jgi:hypothetical protein
VRIEAGSYGRRSLRLGNAERIEDRKERKQSPTVPLHANADRFAILSSSDLPVPIFILTLTLNRASFIVTVVVIVIVIVVIPKLFLHRNCEEFVIL